MPTVILRVSSRGIAAIAALAASLVSTVDSFGQESAKDDKGVVWHDVRTLTVEGRGWPEPELKSPFD